MESRMTAKRSRILLRMTSRERPVSSSSSRKTCSEARPESSAKAFKVRGMALA
jgi:hypothetical protein